MTQPRGSDEGNHARENGGAPDLPPLPPGWAELYIPDDAHELAAEAAQIRSELALDPAWPPRPRSQLASIGPMAALILMVMIAVGSLLIIVHPVGRSAPLAAPLARSDQAPGSIGGLLPDLTLREPDGDRVVARSLRPALLLLIPDGCACPDRTASLVDSSRASLVQVALIGVSSGPRLPPSALVGRTRSLVDVGGTFTNAITPPRSALPDMAITAVLLRSDGVIARILRDPPATAQLQNDLAGLTII